jgi:prevent-host-death family protein
MTEDVLSLSQFRADAARLLDQVRDESATLVLTQNGRARAVVQDYAQYQARERAMLMLKLMAEGERDISAGDTLLQADVFEKLRQQLQAQRDERDGRA